MADLAGSARRSPALKAPREDVRPSKAGPLMHIRWEVAPQAPVQAR
jgi:hypothetical protein